MYSKIIYPVFLVCVGVLTALVVYTPQKGFAQEFKKSQPLNGSVMTVCIYSEPEEKAAAAANAVFSSVATIEYGISRFRKASDFDKLNKSAGKKAVKVKPATLELIQAAFEYHKKTNGAFEPLTGTLSNVWPFVGKSSGRLPKPEKLEKLLPLVDLNQLVVDSEKSTVFLPDKKQRFDSNDLVSGLIFKKAREVLNAKEIKKYFISMNGDSIFSTNGDGGGFRFVLENPRKRGSPTGCIELKNKVIATAGDYERVFIRDGKRYHRILEPKTGMPVTDVRAVTVIAKNPTDAVVYSHAFMVMGVKKALKFCETEKSIEIIITDETGRVHLTSGIKNDFQIGACAAPFKKTY